LEGKKKKVLLTVQVPLCPTSEGGWRKLTGAGTAREGERVYVESPVKRRGRGGGERSDFENAVEGILLFPGCESDGKGVLGTPGKGKEGAE